VLSQLSATQVSRVSDPLDAFLQTNPDIEYIWMQWIDYTATTRVRILPLREFIRIARKDRRIGITLAVQWMLQDDTLTPEGTTTGQFYMEPDLSSLYRNGSLAASAAPSATVMSFWQSEEGKPLDGCPRTSLQNIVGTLHRQHSIDILCGFEIEVVFLKPIISQQTGKATGYVPATKNHSWSQMTADIRKMIPILDEINRVLASVDIHLQQFHAESAPGQFEFILPPVNPLAAIDTLIATRQVITAVAERHGLRATLHPRPFPNGAGSAAHAHVSITPPAREDAFLAGVLKHYPSIVAFTLSQDASYERVRSGIWSGSEWVAWGFQNREAPVRKIGPGHWEFKSVDGVANPYLAVAALLAGGLIGLEENLSLAMKECTGKICTTQATFEGIFYDWLIIFFTVDASDLTSAERSRLGITTPLPQSLAQSMTALSENEKLQSVLGKELVQNYLSVKRAESKRIHGMVDEERRLWLLERY
jgi:glutamine synthetase